MNRGKCLENMMPLKTLVLSMPWRNPWVGTYQRKIGGTRGPGYFSIDPTQVRGRL